MPVMISTSVCQDLSHHLYSGFRSQKPGLHPEMLLFLRLHILVPPKSFPWGTRTYRSELCWIPFTFSCVFFLSLYSISLQITELKSLLSKSLHICLPPPPKSCVPSCLVLTTLLPITVLCLIHPCPSAVACTRVPKLQGPSQSPRWLTKTYSSPCEYYSVA